MYRVSIYIDGFNLYHAIDDLNDDSLKWLDLWSLGESILNDQQILKEVKYFSAYATWRPDSYKRHRDYVTALESKGVKTILGRFKNKRVMCKASCKELFWTHEEKETDVNIGAHLISDALNDKFDTAFVISADTDLAAVIKLTRELIGTDKRVHAIAPPGRYARARELEHLFSITKGKIRAAQLPDLVITNQGTINRPNKYKLPNMNKKITINSVVKAPIEKVWQCWTEPEHITHWAFASDDWEAPSAENDLTVGGRFVTRMQAKDGSAGFDLGGEYTEVVPHQKITYTMDDGRTCTTEFVAVEDGVNVSSTFEMEHENSEELQRAGWQAILNNFKKHVEGE